MSEYETILSNIGLSDKEAKVYLALLALGKANAYQVAVKSGLKKPTSYMILEELQKKGFVSLIPREKKRNYLPISPELLIANYKEKVLLAEKALPAFLAMRRDVLAKPTFTIFEGREACLRISKKLYSDHANQKIYGMYAKADDVHPGDMEYYEILARTVKDNNITGHLVMPDTPESRIMVKNTYLTNNFKVKLLPTRLYDTTSAIEIFDDVVSIESIGKYQIALIESADYAKTMRQLFDFLYTSSDGLCVD